MHNIRLEQSWKRALAPQFDQPYFYDLISFVHKAYKTGTVYPHPRNIFRALDMCPVSDVRVVILGQDPYHGRDQANGLSFAVNDGVSLPPSLRNIYKEIESDMGYIPDRSGDLSRWAKQGVLLLNATLTVEADKPGSHQDRGWEIFTDAIVRHISEHCEHVVFILWGNYARTKGAHIDRTKHCVIESPHPSPFSADRGFFGSKLFSQANTYLQENGKSLIDWH